jgi:secondary thiamine-phosphate synthase enzyme
MKQASHRFEIQTRGKGLYEFTGQVESWVQAQAVRTGLMTLFIQHTSASLTIQENADPDVLRDLMDALERAAPRSGRYRHDTEGPDDMPAHIKTMLTSASLGVPVIGGRAQLGTWQAIYLIEHRDRPHRREVVVHFVGTGKG